MVSLISVVCISVLVGLSEAACPQGWMTKAGHCFFLSRTELSWSDASEMCRDFGASLFTFTDDSAVRLLLQQLMGHHKRDTSYKEIWVGGTDEIQEGHWLWIMNLNGIPQQLPIVRFQETVSHNSDHRNCLSIRADGHHSITWYADECTDHNYFLCEIMNGALLDGQLASEVIG